MTYVKPTLEDLGTVHTLTLTRGGNNDGKCNINSTGKCNSVGDGMSQEAGFS